MTDFKLPNVGTNSQVGEVGNTAVGKKEEKKLSNLYEEIMKHNSFTDRLLNFILHPFVLIGGLLVGVYFLSKQKREAKSADDQNTLLLSEIKKLKKKNKKLQAQLNKLLTSNGALNELPYSKIHQRLLPAKNKATTFYLD